MDSNEHPITPSLKLNCVREMSVKDNCRNSLTSKFPKGTYRLTECIHTGVEVFRELILDLALNLKTSASPNPCTKALPKSAAIPKPTQQLFFLTS